MSKYLGTRFVQRTGNLVVFTSARASCSIYIIADAGYPESKQDNTYTGLHPISVQDRVMMTLSIVPELSRVRQARYGEK